MSSYNVDDNPDPSLLMPGGLALSSNTLTREGIILEVGEESTHALKSSEHPAAADVNKVARLSHLTHLRARSEKTNRRSGRNEIYHGFRCRGVSSV
jgi:hypothetical protein